MTVRGGLTPYAGGRLGLVITEGDAPPLRVLLARAWDVGELKPNPNAALEKDHDYIRVVEPRHIWALEEAVAEALAEHHVTSLVIEEPSGTGVTAGHSRKIGDEIEVAAREAGIAVERRARVAPDLSALSPWPPVDNVPAVHRAAALLIGVDNEHRGRNRRDGIQDRGERASAPVHGGRLCDVQPERDRIRTARSGGQGADTGERAFWASGVDQQGHLGTGEEEHRDRPSQERLTLPGTVIIGFDLGSAHMGVAIVAGALPLDVIDALTLGVDPNNLDTVVAVAVELAIKAGATRSAIEHGVKFYVPDGASKQQIMSMAQAHAICGQLQRKLTEALTAEGIEAITWARQSWAHRVVQHHQGSITTAAANEGVRAQCAPGSWERLGDQHQRDAGGVACMFLVEPPTPTKRYRAPRARPAVDPDAPAPAALTPEEREAKRQRCWRERKRDERHTATDEQRAEAGCDCKPLDSAGKRRQGAHLSTCPLSVRYQRLQAAIGHGPYLR